MVSEADDDDLLAARSRNGDGVALARLYQRHAPPLLRYLERGTGSRQEAEDILQETFVRLFEGRGRYDGRGRFRSWLFTVATRLLLDRARCARRYADLLQSGDAPWVPPDQIPSDALLPVRTQRRLEHALADLPEDYALAFHLRVLEGFSYAEMAAVSGAPEGTLRSRVHHAVRRIRAALAVDPRAVPSAPAPCPDVPEDSCHNGESR